MKKFIKVTILLVLLTLMFVSSCFVGFAKEKVITFARSQELQFMDPCDMGFYTVNVILDYMVYDRLIDLDETGTGFVPALATEWKRSPDGKEYTFKLREGVKFHNEEPFNAECVKVTLERFLTEPTLRRRSEWAGLKEVEVVDDYTAIIRFHDVNNTCLAYLSQMQIIPAKAFKEKGTALFKNPIGTGAFTWGHYKSGLEVVLNKNPDYWGKPAYMDKFVYLPIFEMSTRLAGVLTGEIDIVDAMAEFQVPVVEDSGNIKVERTLTWDNIYLGLKQDTPPFTDIKFRQAIALAIDKEGIVKHVMKNGRVSTGIIPQGIVGFDDSLVPIKRDIEKAKQLVKESIYDGRTIDIICSIGWFPNYRELAQVILGNFTEIGINAKLSLLEGGAYIERRAAADYDVFINQDTSLLDLNMFLTRIVVMDTRKMGKMNPELKELAIEQSKIIDKQKRIEMLRKIENIVNTDFAPMIVITQYETIYFQQKGIQGARYYGNKNPDFRYVHYEEWL